MLKFSVMFLYLAVVAVSIWSVSCVSEDDKSAMLEALKPITKDCINFCGLDEEKKTHMKGDDDFDPCFKKCFLIKVGLLDENGKYNREEMHKKVAEYTENKEEAQKFQDELDNCFDEKGDNKGDDDAAVMKRVDIVLDCMKKIKQ